ncbi:hypothetical protein TRFO_27986 [Tritrichomonas foetus]|uniref:Ubiquitin-like domain-containing protein n=1 Tax=Tritrichomonas foetus TaxID=1144522 RepID=A0A1J4JZD1_9EUKA|nr:hypothetical protein TRFO_27986 [Tritrichomonas foetus]|eukprot:OHT04535.1 hypothetical protein TRFO_27986 [Tritrichomonas foetus]
MLPIQSDFSSSMSLTADRSRDVSSRNLFSSNISLKALDDLSSAPANQQYGLDYGGAIERRPPSLKPEGNLIIRSPGMPPFTIPYNSWESLSIIKARIAEHLDYDVEPFHYVTDHGTIQQTELLRDYQVTNNSIVLMIPKNQFEKEKLKIRNAWINRKSAMVKRPPKIIVPKKTTKKKKKPPFYLI